MAVPIEGRFVRFSAEARFDPERLQDGAVSIVIDIASVEAVNDRVASELRKPNWFKVAIHPTARFETTAFRRKGDAFEAEADLTMRSVTRRVTLPFDISATDDPARAGRLIAKAAGELKVRRLDFGIGQAEWRDTSIVADELIIRIEVTARRAK